MAIRFGYGVFLSTKTIPVDSAFFNQVAQLKQSNTNNGYAVNYYQNDRRYNNNDDDENYTEPSNHYTIKGELFEFDPNTLSVDGWKRLGLREKTIQTIQNYLSKGGRFRSPEDIKHVYGLFPNEAERLLPYIKIKNSDKSDFKIYDKNYIKTNNISYSRPVYVPKSIDINTADTTAFIALPGIGSKLAYRIVSFREKLGGFYSIDQVGEVYGLLDSTFQKIKSRLVLSNSTVKQFNINTSDAAALKTHPYFKWSIANAIVQYRMQHGNFISLTDLKKIALIDEQLYNKIVPYLTL